MSKQVPSLPASGRFLEAIRETSHSLRDASNVKISSESIERLLKSPAFTSTFARVSTAHGLALPLNFSSKLSELNLICVLALLNFGSGFRVPLHIEIGRGAWDTIRMFVFSLYLSSATEGAGDLMSAAGMNAIGEGKVAELLGVNVHVERPHESIPGVVVGELGGPMHQLVQHITGVMNSTGRFLIGQGYPDLGSFVIEALKEGAKSKGDVLEVVLERLVRAFPGFRDMAIVDGAPVYCFKKALFLVHSVVVRFGSYSPPPFPIPNTSHSPVFTDNVIPSLLVYLGVLDLSEANNGLSSVFSGAGSEESLSTLLAVPEDSEEKKVEPKGKKTPPKEGPILTIPQAYILRASALDACEMIVAAAKTLDVSPELEWIHKITLPELDMWLWSVAKDRPDYRSLERFVLKDTIFF